MNKGRLIWTLAGLGWYIGIAIALPVLVGWWLDGKYDSAPLFIFIGLGLGLFLAFTGVYRVLRTMEKEQNN